VATVSGLDDLGDVTSALLRARAAAVEQHLRGILTARGIDPDDRSDGWEDRARSALARRRTRRRRPGVGRHRTARYGEGDCPPEATPVIVDVEVGVALARPVAAHRLSRVGGLGRHRAGRLGHRPGGARGGPRRLLDGRRAARRGHAGVGTGPRGDGLELVRFLYVDLRSGSYRPRNSGPRGARTHNLRISCPESHPV
jgi:hypothetical protein